MFEGTVRNTEGDNKRQALSIFLSVSLIGGTLLALLFMHPEVQDVKESDDKVSKELSQAFGLISLVHLLAPTSSGYSCSFPAQSPL